MTSTLETTSSPLTGGPLVVACLRVTDLRPRVDPLTGAVSRDVWGIDVGPSDAAALELALRAAEAWGGRVLAVSAGPPAVEPVLRTARALGASALRVPLEEDQEVPPAEELAADEHRLARRIIGALAPFGSPALVLCGDRSTDRGTGALPAFVAHELGAAQALGLVGLELGAGGEEQAERPRSVVADRRLDGGWRERLVVPLPAVCSVEAAGVTLRRASLVDALAAEAAPVPVAPLPLPTQVGPQRVGLPRPYRPRTHVLPAPEGADPRTRLLALTGALDEHDPPLVIGPVGPEAAADAFLDFLARHGYFTPTEPEPGGRGTPA